MNKEEFIRNFLKSNPKVLEKVNQDIDDRLNENDFIGLQLGSYLKEQKIYNDENNLINSNKELNYNNYASLFKESTDLNELIKAYKSYALIYEKKDINQKFIQKLKQLVDEDVYETEKIINTLLEYDLYSVVISLIENGFVQREDNLSILIKTYSQAEEYNKLFNLLIKEYRDNLNPSEQIIENLYRIFVKNINKNVEFKLSGKLADRLIYDFTYNLKDKISFDNFLAIIGYLETFSDNKSELYYKILGFYIKNSKVTGFPDKKISEIAGKDVRNTETLGDFLARMFSQYNLQTFLDTFDRLHEVFKFYRSDKDFEYYLNKEKFSNQDIKEFLIFLINNNRDLNAWLRLGKYFRAMNKTLAELAVLMITKYLLYSPENVPKRLNKLLSDLDDIDSSFIIFFQNNLLLLKRNINIKDYWERFFYFFKTNPFIYIDKILSDMTDYFLSKQNFTANDKRLFKVYYSKLKDYNSFYEKFFSESSNSINFKTNLSNNFDLYLTIIKPLISNVNSINDEYLKDLIYFYGKPEELKEEEKVIIGSIQDLYSRIINNNKPKDIDLIIDLLSFYPNQPNKDFIKKLMERDLSLIETSLNIYTSNQYLKELLKLVSFDDLPSKDETRTEFFEVRKNILKKMFYLHEKENKVDYLDLIKQFRSMEYLTSNNIRLSDSTKENNKVHHEIERILKQENKFDEFKQYEEILDELVNSKMPQDFVEKLVYFGITNSWEPFILDLLNDPKQTKKIDFELVNKYINSIDSRSFNKSFIQMFFYTLVAGLTNKLNERKLTVSFKSINVLKAIHDNKVEPYQERMIKDKSFSQKEINSLLKLSENLNPLHKKIMEFLLISKNNEDDEQLIKYLGDFDFIRSEEKWDKVSRVLTDHYFNAFKEIIVPYVTMTQYPEDLKRIIHNLSFKDTKKTLPFLQNEYVQEKIGEFTTNVYLTVCYLRQDKYSKAKNIFNKLDKNIPENKEIIAELENAIEKRESIDEFEFIPYSNKLKLPRLSFMNETNAAGENYHNLMAQFNSKDLYLNSKSRCKIASKIYFLYLNDDHDLSADFLFNWGFYAINNKVHYRDKLNILFELIDNGHLLNDSQILGLKDKFVKNFHEIFVESDYNTLFNYCQDLKVYYSKIYKKYQPIDEGNVYVKIFELMSELKDVYENEKNPDNKIKEIKNVRSKVLNLRNEYHNRRLINETLNYIESLIAQINANGLIEVKILNENNEFSDTIFYQVKNIGYEAIDELEITLNLDGYEQSYSESINVNKEINGSLRPGKIFAEEYKPSSKCNLKVGDTVKCNVDLKYNDKEYRAESKELKVINKVIAKNRPIKVGKYDTTTVTNYKNFIIRSSLLEKVQDALNDNKSFVLYGTNGTGKSSLLNYINRVEIPNCVNQEKDSSNEAFIPITIRLNGSTDEHYTTAINDLLDSICGKSSKLYLEIMKLGLKFPEINFDETLEQLKLAGKYKKENKIFKKKHRIRNNKIITIFEKVSEALALNNLRLYFIWDDFEKIISSKYVDSSDLEFLRTFSESEVKNNISFIISGSNYLLEKIEIESNDENTWNYTLSRLGPSIKVGNFERSDFDNLMTQERVLGKENIVFKDEALNYLYEYTNGHAFYSYIIGNRVLEILKNQKDGRKSIYPSDVFHAIYYKEKYLSDSQIDRDKEATIHDQIFQDINKRVNVLVFGKILADLINNTGQEWISLENLRKKVTNIRTDVNNNAFNDAFSILYSRDFINKTDKNGEVFCKFTSDIYFEHFLNVNIPEGSEEEIKENQEKLESIEEISANLLKFPKVLIDHLKNITINCDFNNYGTIAMRDLYQNNFQFNVVNNISNFFSNVFNNNISNEVKIESYKDLPKLKDYNETYLSDDEKVQLNDLVKQLETETNPERQEEISEKIDSIESKPRETMMLDYMRGYVSIEDIFTNSLDNKKLKDILYTDAESLEELKTLIPVELQLEYNFALRLHFIFSKFKESLDEVDKGKEENKDLVIDYCPIVLLYSKIVESLLQIYHVPIYIQFFGEDTIKYRGPRFRHLTDPHTYEANKANLTIGSFAYALVAPDYNNIHGGVVRDRKISNCIPGTELQEEWKRHAKNIDIVRGYRNLSAHDNVPMDFEQLRELVTILFKDHELKEIIMLKDKTLNSD